MQRQQAMFAASDALSPSAFYVAADVWSRKKGQWGLGKVFGAFSDAVSFAHRVLMGNQRAPTRCFYEIIREGCPCKAYFDLEVEPGVMDRLQGAALCEQVVLEWAARVRAKWPQAIQQCPRCLEVMILNGSRQTKKGWKVSYHLIFPWLTFPCNNTLLKEEVATLSALPQFCYTTSDGANKGFIDSAVYTRNRQFRLALSHKLSDETQTPLSLPTVPQLSTFLLSCITRIETDSWRVPVEASSIGRGQPCALRRDSAQPFPPKPSLAPTTPSIVQSINALLHQHGLPAGTLHCQKGNIHEGSFRWGADKGAQWPCLVAQVWRPANPTHDSNGGMVSFDRSRAVFFQCLHPDCQRLSRKPGVFLGYVPMYDPNVQTQDSTHSGSLPKTRGAKRMMSANPGGRKKAMTDGRTTSPQETEDASAQLDPLSTAQVTVRTTTESTARSSDMQLTSDKQRPIGPATTSQSLSLEQSLRHVYLKNQDSPQNSFKAH